MPYHVGYNFLAALSEYEYGRTWILVVYWYVCVQHHATCTQDTPSHHHRLLPRGDGVNDRLPPSPGTMMSRLYRLCTVMFHGM